MDIVTAIKEIHGIDIVREIDNISTSSGIGNISSNTQNMLRGLNYRGLGNPQQKILQNTGITLFTRPTLNLTYDNLTLIRMLTPLLTENELSMPYYVKALLDPINNKGLYDERYDTPLVDSNNPFMPVYTNTLLETSGWPDISLNTYTSPEGIYKQNTTMPDGHYKIMNSWELTTTHRNDESDVLLLLNLVWIIYMVGIRLVDGFWPHPKSIINSRRDYYTGIWSLSLDPSRLFVREIFRTFGYPTNVPLGAAANYKGQDTMVQSKDQVSFQFKCEMTDYNDPILPVEFNRLAARYTAGRLAVVEANADGSMRVADSRHFIQLKPTEFKNSNYRGIPMIHPRTGSLYWYVTEFEYNNLR